MRLLALIVPATALLPYVLAQVQVWGQCGGMDWAHYMRGRKQLHLDQPIQCLPGSQPPTSGLPPTPTTSTITTTTTNSPSCTPSPRGALQPRATGPPIAALDGWAAGSYLQKDRNSKRMVNRKWKPSFDQLFWYMHIVPVLEHPPCSNILQTQSGTTFNWGFNGPNSTLSTSDGFNTFVTCSGGALYLQTGTDVPSGNCTTTRLQIGQY
ncbi:fungal cellulose binding domain-containing protein [Rhizoctonia solani AG-1 IA]|uniref:Fungal cellulose binding domain-containing protein n=1 Tax=Thanatephorus cucumeris (strain AG1-IA) TaxID=983506 RepID=L8WVZ3_THACA|nr:fungal cellulose binding domain-containing protein [Rhizoctonia solani AG-1 IA]